MAKLDDRVNVEMDPEDALRLLLGEERHEPEDDADDGEANAGGAVESDAA